MYPKVAGLAFILATVFGATSAACECGNDESDPVVRLSGGNTARAGRLEVCREGKWNTVCAQRFNSTDATIVCRELGFSDEGARPIHSGFSPAPNSRPIWLVDTLCNGTEETILDCPDESHRGTQLQLCTHASDVGVRCQAARTGELRILGGRNTSSGRLEVFNDGQWGTVCQDRWSLNDARVACGQLGFSANGARAIRSGFRKRLNSDSAPIWLDQLQCSGKEDTLFDCTSNQIGRHNCDHTEDVGVTCRRGNLMELLFRGLLMEAEQKKVAREQMVDQAIEQAVAQEILMTLLGEQ